MTEPRHCPWHGSYSAGGEPVPGALRMGLRPIDEADWLPPADDAQARAADRAARLARDPDAHFACPPDAQDAAREVLKLLAAHTRRPPDPAELADPLRAAAARVPDDLCLLSPEDPPRLRAAVLTAASSWRLCDKLNQDLTAIHAPVPELNARLGARMRDFMARMPADRIFERANWFLYDDGAWDRSEGEALGRIPPALGTEPAVAEQLWLRMERQTLRRLPETGWLLFTIRIHRHPVTELARHPRLAAHLRTAMASLDATERRARRLDLVGPGLDAWLASVAAPHTEARA